MEAVHREELRAIRIGIALNALTTSRVLLLAVLAGGPSGVALAQGYSYQLQARANFVGAFNLPNSAFFTNSTPRLGDLGHIAFDLEVLPGAGQGLWAGSNGLGSVVYGSPLDTFILDIGQNDAGVVVFDLAQSAQDGVYRYDPATGLTTFATNQPLGASGWGTPQINNLGDLAFRAGFPGGRAFVRIREGVQTVYAAEAGIDIASPYSFLFTPSFNSSWQLAAKVRRGASGQLGESQPDEIRVFGPKGSFLVASDRDGDPGSNFQSFDNTVSINENGLVAFLATEVGGQRGVFVLSGGIVTRLAHEGLPEIGTIEFFPPSAGESGAVVFRATDANGLRTIWLARANTPLVRVVGEHDLVPTDLGPARIDQHDGSPVFGGGPTVNGFDEVAFNASLTPADDDQIEWGSGIFIARPVLGDAIFSDGFEGGNTGAWSLTTP